jgi:hypothetical protein
MYKSSIKKVNYISKKILGGVENSDASGDEESKTKYKFYLDQSITDLDVEAYQNLDEIIKFGTGEEYIKTMLQKLDTMKTDPKFIEFYNILPSHAKVAITTKFISEFEKYSSIFSKEIARNYGIDEKLWINQLNDFLVNYKKLNTEETYNMLSTVESYNNYSKDTISSFLKKREKYFKSNSVKVPWKGGEGEELGEKIVTILNLMVKTGACGFGMYLGLFITGSIIGACAAAGGGATLPLCLGLMSSVPPLGFAVLSPTFFGVYLCMQLFESEMARNEQNAQLREQKRRSTLVNGEYDNLNVFKVGDIVIVKGRNNFYRINKVDPIYIFDPTTVTRKAIIKNYELCEIIKQKANDELKNIATTNNIITRGHGDLWLLLKIGDKVLYKEDDDNGISKTSKGYIKEVTVDKNMVRSLRWSELKFFGWSSVKKITYRIEYDEDSPFKSYKSVENNSCWFWHRFSLLRPQDNERYEFSIGETVNYQGDKYKIVKIRFDDLDTFGKKLTYFITPFCVENAKMATLHSLIYARDVSALNEKRCKNDSDSNGQEVEISTDSSNFEMKKWVDDTKKSNIDDPVTFMDKKKPLSLRLPIVETAVVPTN